MEKTVCEISVKLTMKTPERRKWPCSDVFSANFEQISNIIMVFPVMTFNK